jgi:hypothetical protein
VLTDTNTHPVDTVVNPVVDTTTASTETVPTGGLTTIADILKPNTQVTTVDTDAPIAGNLLTTGLPTDQPVGGLNATAVKTADDKTTESQGVKASDITKPIVATFGNLLKSGLSQPKRTTVKPTGGLKMASVAPKLSTLPPAKVDVSKLIPLQKSTMPTKVATVAPPKTLASTAKLSPVTNIAGLTSLVKKV